MNLYTQIQKLHKKYGASIPLQAYKPELIKLLSDFKEEFTDWHDSEVFWVLANIDRYNNLLRILKEQRKELSNGIIKQIKEKYL